MAEKVKVKGYYVKAHDRKARSKKKTTSTGTAKKKTFSNKIGKYNSWDLYDKMPIGWKKDGDALKAPGKGMVFITNGKSPLKGGKRALLKLKTVSKAKPKATAKTKRKPVAKKKVSKQIKLF